MPCEFPILETVLIMASYYVLRPQKQVSRRSAKPRRGISRIQFNHLRSHFQSHYQSVPFTATLMPAASTPAASGQTSGFGDSGLLARCVRLLCGSCSSGQRFALGFLPTNASRPRSCPSARPSLCRAVNRLTPFLSVRCFTVEQVRPAGRTAQKSPQKWGLSTAHL